MGKKGVEPSSLLPLSLAPALFDGSDAHGELHVSRAYGQSVAYLSICLVLDVIFVHDCMYSLALVRRPLSRIRSITVWLLQ
jgi:hypothetical protein